MTESAESRRLDIDYLDTIIRVQSDVVPMDDVPPEIRRRFVRPGVDFRPTRFHKHEYKWTRMGRKMDGLVRGHEAARQCEVSVQNNDALVRPQVRIPIGRIRRHLISFDARL
jgi:hypothetical protein